MREQLDELSKKRVVSKKPAICICGHSKDTYHGGWGGVRACKVCDCEHYIRNLECEGDYVSCTPFNGDLIESGFFGDYHYKQISNYVSINEKIIEKYEKMPELP